MLNEKMLLLTADSTVIWLSSQNILILKAPITTAADDKFCDIFPNFQKNKGVIFHENRLPADDSHEISFLICYFQKGDKI